MDETEAIEEVYTLIQNMCNSLHSDAEDGWLESVQMRINDGADVNSLGYGGQTPLKSGAANGHLEVVKCLIAAGANVNMKDGYGKTALHYSTNKGYLDVVKVLIAADANVNMKDGDEKTALHYSTLNGHLDVVKVLIAADADVNLKDRWGSTALHNSAKNGYLGILKALITAGANINVVDNHRNSALRYSAKKGCLDTVKALIASNADIHMKDKIGNTALHYSAGYGHLKIVKVLIAAGADICVKNIKGMAPLHLAYKNKKERVLFLIKYAVLMNYRIMEQKCFSKVSVLSQFHKKCLEQVKHMREMKLGRSYASVFEFLTTTDENKIALYSSEEIFGIINESERAQYKDKFPTYAHDFEVQYGRGEERARLLHETQELMGICFPKMLPLEIRKMISEYLTTDDLDEFVYTCRTDEVAPINY